MKRILIIQSASLGDVILSTSIAETLHRQLPGAEIHYLIKKGYESLFTGHPFISKVLQWDKSKGKYSGLLNLALGVRNNGYEAVINVHRFVSSGFITAVSGAGIRSGFSKNPLSLFYTHKFRHQIHDGNPKHETARNHELISMLASGPCEKPALYPGKSDYEFTGQFSVSPYITISPASLWFTKQYPEEKWIEFLRNIPGGINVLLLGSETDRPICERIALGAKREVSILAGRLSFLQSAALMKSAKMNYVNDSAPQHLASAVNAPVAAIFCSTVPAFGFGPLSEVSHIIETDKELKCRPCGLHGHSECPEKHFNCAHLIKTNKLTDLLK